MSDAREEAAPEAAQRPDQASDGARLISYLVLAVTGGLLFAEAATLPASRWEPLGTGTFPMIALGVLIALSLLAAAGSLRRLAGTGALARLGGEAAGWCVRRRLVLAVLALLALYLATIRWAGFGVSTFAFLLLTQLLLAPRTPRAAAIALVLALVFSFGLQALFAEVFLVFLPRGVW